MGLNLSAPILHEESVRTTFRARSFGSWLVELFRICTIIIVPIVVSLHAGNMWLTLNTFSRMPTTNYTGRYLLKATDSAGGEYLYTSSAAVMSLLEGDTRNANPFVSYMADDVDNDGKTDYFVFTIAIEPRSAVAPITKLQFLPTFDYEINATNYVNLHHKMSAGPLVTVVPSSTSTASSTTTAHIIEGSLVFSQVEPLDAYYVTSYAEAYAGTFLTDSNVRSVSDLRQIEKFARMYSARNETLSFDASKMGGAAETVDVVASGNAALQTLLSSGALATPTFAGTGLFVAQIKMRVVPAVVQYQPAPSEVAKWAWVQWFCIGLPITWLLQWFVAVLVRNAVVTTTAIYQGMVRPN